MVRANRHPFLENVNLIDLNDPSQFLQPVDVVIAVREEVLDEAFAARLVELPRGTLHLLDCIILHQVGYDKLEHLMYVVGTGDHVQEVHEDMIDSSLPRRSAEGRNE